MELLIVSQEASLPGKSLRLWVECCALVTGYYCWCTLLSSLSQSLYWPRLGLHDTYTPGPHSSRSILDPSSTSTADDKTLQGEMGTLMTFHQQVSAWDPCDRACECWCHWWFMLRLSSMSWLLRVSQCQTGDWLSEDTRIEAGRVAGTGEGGAMLPVQRTHYGWSVTQPLTCTHTDHHDFIARLIKYNLFCIVISSENVSGWQCYPFSSPPSTSTVILESSTSLLLSIS